MLGLIHGAWRVPLPASSEKPEIDSGLTIIESTTLREFRPAGALPSQLQCRPFPNKYLCHLTANIEDSSPSSQYPTLHLESSPPPPEGVPFRDSSGCSLVARSSKHQLSPHLALHLSSSTVNDARTNEGQF